MKKHFKILSVLALMLILPLCVLATGCVAGNASHKAGTKYGHDANFHWNTCACEESDCTEKYNIEAHTWIDGSPSTTATETTTPQMCECGATNNKITRTDAQIKTLFTKLCTEYDSGNKTFTMSGGGLVASFNSSTNESIIVPAVANNRQKIVKDGNNYKKYNEGTHTYYNISLTETLPEMFVQFAVMAAEDTAVIETTTNAYRIKFADEHLEYEVSFNSTDILSVKEGEFLMIVTDTFDTATFNAFDTTGYTEATN